MARLPERHSNYRELSNQELAAILKELPRRPPLAGEEGIQLSLAGAQDKLAIRLAPLYDVVCTVYYAELSPTMAMRIGEEYSSEKMSLKDFEQLAVDAKLGKPLVRARLREVTDRIMAAIPKVPIRDPVTERVADVIRRRCEAAATRVGRGRVLRYNSSR